MYYDSGKIFAGLAIFVLFITFPVWYNLGDAGAKPKPELPTTEKQCVEPADEMRANHMKLLNQWRDSALRDGIRVYETKNESEAEGYEKGKEYAISLQNTCMNCHKSKKKFCDTCHTYAAVAPYCWDCHIAPTE
jgi:hypothetical protein